MATVNLDTSVRLDIVCRKGDTFSLPIDFQSAQSANGWGMQVRLTDTTEDSTILNVEDGFSVSDGVATNSLLTVSISADDMAAVSSGLYVYDIQQEVGATVSTKLYGTFKVNEDITV